MHFDPVLVLRLPFLVSCILLLFQEYLPPLTINLAYHPRDGLCPRDNLPENHHSPFHHLSRLDNSRLDLGSGTYLVELLV